MGKMNWTDTFQMKKYKQLIKTWKNVHYLQSLDEISCIEGAMVIYRKMQIKTRKIPPHHSQNNYHQENK
jgi:hypothetical protein